MGRIRPVARPQHSVAQRNAAAQESRRHPYYTTVVPEWNPGGFVLMHFFNDRSETEGNLSPLYNSIVDVRYQLHCDGTGADSSDNVTKYGAKGIFRTPLNNTIQGWYVALPQMRCGDSAEVIVPYGLGYGASSSGVIKSPIRICDSISVL